ncbi:MAG: DUF7487 domain-containing protein [Nitrosopumilaceae archaeon]
MSERIYCIFNNITAQKLCQMCTNIVKYDGQKYRTYCSTKCQLRDPISINRRKETCFQKYNTSNPLMNKEVRAKRDNTMYQLYGTTHALRVENFKKKAKQTTALRFGVEHAAQSPIIKEKTKTQWLEKFGVSNPMKNQSIKQKIQQHFLEKYNVNWHTQTHIPPNIIKHLDDQTWLYEQHYVLKKPIIQIAKECNIDLTSIQTRLKKFNIAVKYYTGYSYKAITWLESIIKKENTFIQHALNEGEFKIPNTRFLVDGYCKETNTVYEFYGDLFHGNPEIFEPTEKCHPFDLNITAGELYRRTIERENLIKEMGYNLIVVWENKWNKNNI